MRVIPNNMKMIRANAILLSHQELQEWSRLEPRCFLTRKYARKHLKLVTYVEQVHGEYADRRAKQ